MYVTIKQVTDNRNIYKITNVTYQTDVAKTLTIKDPSANLLSTFQFTF